MFVVYTPKGKPYSRGESSGEAIENAVLGLCPGWLSREARREKWEQMKQSGWHLQQHRRASKASEGQS